MTNQKIHVIGGVDTHKDVHVAAVVDDRGKILDTAAFDADTRGYRALLRWMRSFGVVEKVGVEGTGAYGAGLTRHLCDENVEVLEVNRPNRQMRRLRGKSDTVDAEAAARSALNGEASVIPKDRSHQVESIRVLRVAFCSARDAKTRVALQIRDLIVTAPVELRESLSPLPTAKRVDRCARFRPGNPSEPIEATRLALRALAHRYQDLSKDQAELGEHLDRLTAQVNPALRAAKGVGPDVAGILLVAAGDNATRLTSESAFAAMCGVSPIEASSGKTVRHRLNRSGNRQANHALWRIAMVRMANDEETKTYTARRLAEGKTKREVIRCLKRHIAREVFIHLTNPVTIPDGLHLRQTRIRAKISLQVASDNLGTWPTSISRLERGILFDRDLAERYRSWLNQQTAA
jgi:transposase